MMFRSCTAAVPATTKPGSREDDVEVVEDAATLRKSVKAPPRPVSSARTPDSSTAAAAATTTAGSSSSLSSPFPTDESVSRLLQAAHSSSASASPRPSSSSTNRKAAAMAVDDFDVNDTKRHSSPRVASVRLSSRKQQQSGGGAGEASSALAAFQDVDATEPPPAHRQSRTTFGSPATTSRPVSLTSTLRASLSKVPGLRTSISASHSSASAMAALASSIAFIPTTDAMARLDTVIQSDKGRQELVRRLLPLPGDLVTKVRFCNAVEQYDAHATETQEDRDRKLLQAVVICDMFLKEGSAFCVWLSTGRRDYILEGNNFDHLMEAKREVLHEMCKIDDVRAIVDDVEGMDGV